MKIKAKIKLLPPIYKGHDITLLRGGREHAETVDRYGEVQASYKHSLLNGDFGNVILYLFNDEQYFIVKINGEIKNCIYL